MLGHYATSRKVVGSIGFFNWPTPSCRTMALGSTQPLTEMSTRNLPGDKGRAGGRQRLNLTTSPSSVSRAVCRPRFEHGTSRIENRNAYNSLHWDKKGHHWLTHSSEQSRSEEANSRPANQDKAHLKWKLKVQCHVQMTHPLDPVLNPMNPIHNINPYFLKIHFNIVTCMSDYRQGLDW
jgi:hypothetical protein